MRPSWNPRRVQSDLREEEELSEQTNLTLERYYQGILSDISTVPLCDVPDQIICELSKVVTVTKGHDWRELVHKLLPMSTTEIEDINYRSSHRLDPKYPLELFLTDKFRDGTFDKLVEVLISENYYQVLSEIQPEVKKFVEEDLRNSQSSRRRRNTDPISMESGYQSLNSRSPENSQEYTSTFRSNTPNEHRNGEPQREFISPDKKYLKSAKPIYPEFQNLHFEHASSPGYPTNGVIPNELINPTIMSSFSGGPVAQNNLGPPSIFDDIPVSKTSDTVKVFIPHTEKEKDEEDARALAKSLKDEYNMDTMVLRDAEPWLQVDAQQFVLKLMEAFDFIVPMLSEDYLREIIPTGNTNTYSTDRLHVRYIHVAYQNRYLNKNSLNYHVHPVVVGGVLPGIVRERLEFQMPLKYPDQVPRLAKKLKNTKMLIGASMVQQAA